MFIHYRTRGFIIKKNDRGEASQVFTVFTEDFGKLKFLAKAVRKIKSKLRGGLKLFSLSEIEFIQGKAYKTLTDTKTRENFDKIPKSLIRLKIAYKIAEVSDKLLREEEKDQQIWNLFSETFQRLNSGSRLPYFPSHQILTAGLQGRKFLGFTIYYYFFWNLIDLIGYRPSVYNCAVCQKKLTLNCLYFNPEEGGVICSNCYKKLKSGKEISADLVKILRVILKKDWKTFCRIKIKPSHYKALKNISNEYYNFLVQDFR